MLLHHKPMLIGVQKGVKNEDIAMFFVQNAVFLDFQNRKSAPFHRSSFLFQEFTEAVFLSLFRTKRRKERDPSSGHLCGSLVRNGMECWIACHAKAMPHPQKGCGNYGCEEFELAS